MNRRAVAMVLTFCLGGGVFAQQAMLKKYDSILEKKELLLTQKITEVEALINQYKEKSDSLDTAEIYHDFAKKVVGSQFEKGIEYQEKAIEIREQYYGEYPKLLKVSLSNLGVFYYNNGDYAKALKNYDKVLELCDKIEKRAGRINFNKGRCFLKTGDYKKALDCFDRSESVYVNHPNEKKWLLKIYINVLSTYFDLNEVKYKKAFFKVYEKIQELNKSYDIIPDKLIKIKINLGGFYDTLEEYDSSIKVYNEALDLSLAIEDSIHTSKVLNDLGVVNKKVNNIKEAEHCLNIALKYAANLPIEKGRIYDNLGDLALLEENYEKGLKYYHKAISLVVNNVKEDHTTMPDFKSVALSINKVDALIYIIDKASAWSKFAEAENNETYYKYALQSFELAGKLIDDIYFESREDLSKFFWRKKGADLYLGATRVSYKLNEPEKAFCFIEKSKAFLLLENVTNLNAKAAANLPDEVVKREFDLLRDINEFREKLEEEEKQNTSKIEYLKNKVFSKKDEYSKFIDSLEIAFPEYHNYKKGVQIYNVGMVQEYLKEDQFVLQYKIGENQAYVSLISKKESSIFKIKEAELLNKRILEIQKYLRKPFVKKSDEDNYRELAFKLYKQLFPFEEGKIGLLKNKRLIIIQDGVLQNIPFEPLIVENKNKPINELFLLNFCEISYAYSFSSLMSSSMIERKYENDCLAMSPTHYEDDSLPSLIGYEDEVKTLEKELRTEVQTEENATKQKFIEAYGEYKVVHLSTHGGVTLEEKPWLAFYDDKLELDEMYFTNQYADLIVLSACKTSLGEFKKGEGVMSIARGFVNSGAKSVLASHWNIDQKSNNEIISTFYERLNEGETKIIALNKAKLDYIDKYKNTSEVSPYYWSGITLVGNDAPVFDKKNKRYLWLLLLVPVWLIYKRRKLASA